MKTTKFLLAILLIPYSLSICHAQLNEAHKKGVCNAYMRANYIFEGKIISSKYITIKTGERTYANFSSYLVQVNKVIKGNIQIGTIEIVAWAPGITYKGDDHTVGGLIYDGPAPPPDEGIYFTKVEEHRKDSNVANTNSKSLRYWDAIPVSNGELVKESRGITQYFSTLTEFYDYISKNYGIKIDSVK